MRAVVFLCAPQVLSAQLEEIGHDGVFSKQEFLDWWEDIRPYRVFEQEKVRPARARQTKTSECMAMTWWTKNADTSPALPSPVCAGGSQRGSPEVVHFQP